ncbi:S8 family serine peptidase [Simiduia agarivorans]|uniref:Cold-active alkaline serine protease n=1 Tax=Simiduia agarivorans (strain DSM 21679 / JCM 13881 / BCRC 17597 / SA1) TaxID=1117647 RepID=K4KIX3_SIMAS|nr:S8 family serine peptidase [Simiduia agarivorans]AFU98140.1 cold-active alkaline serine protease [Simiduia agarivorans SA1 = DSM 21679]
MTKKPLAIATCIAAALITQAASAEERYIVKFKEGKGKAAQVLAEKMGGKKLVGLERQNAMAMTLPTNAMNGLTKSGLVEFVEEDVKRFPMAQAAPYGIAMVQADQLSDGLAGNRTVCIIDSGYNLGHPDLQTSLVSGHSDPGGAGNWYEDQNHHGTHVAGTIAALNNNEGVVGVLPNGNLKLYIVKVFDANGWAYSSSLVDALNRCESAGANVVNMSLGGSFKSRTEERAFNDANSRGVLSIAAAGNDGNTRHSYPASYSSVVSVAAIDQNKVVADFSQQTDQVELAAPGVGVVSTVPDQAGTETAVTVAGAGVDSLGMDGSPQGTGSGALMDCGLGEAVCSNANGKVCLIERGNIAFADKVLACENGGGVAAIIYNNTTGPLSGTLGETSTSIPSVGITAADGASLKNQLGANASVSVSPSDYAAYDGTSMATPHVAGVAALVWSHHSSCSNEQIRSALRATAQDLGVAGRDNAYGYGLVQALAAKTYLDTHGCSGDGSGGGNGGGNGGCKGGPKKCG